MGHKRTLSTVVAERQSIVSRGRGKGVALTVAGTETRSDRHSGTCNASEPPARPRWAGDSLFKPETVRQARTFDTYANRYQSVGLCDYCAAQAAFGHQHGFSVVEPVGDCCIAIVSRLPKSEHCCWRSMNVNSPMAVRELRRSIGEAVHGTTTHETCQTDINGRQSTFLEAA